MPQTNPLRAPPKYGGNFTRPCVLGGNGRLQTRCPSGSPRAAAAVGAKAPLVYYAGEIRPQCAVFKVSNFSQHTKKSTQ